MIDTPLIYRSMSLLLRTSIPFALIAVADVSLLGDYYLFSMSYTIAAILIALELSTPFSARYLHAADPRARGSTFVEFQNTVAIVAAAMAAPLVLGFCFFKALPADVGIVLYAFLISEAVVNEANRFAWNIAATRAASARDLVRALLSATLVVLCILATHQVFTKLLLASLSVGNAILIVRDRRYLGGSLGRGAPAVRAMLRGVGQIPGVIAAAMRSSYRQFCFTQSVGLHALLERAVIDKVGGSVLLGSYSLQASLVQAGIVLLLQPRIGEVRRVYLAAADTPARIAARKAILQLALLASVAFLVAGYVLYLAAPLLRMGLHKDIESSLPLYGAFFLSLSAQFLSTLGAPYFADRSSMKVLLAQALAGALPLLIACMPFVAGSVAGGAVAADSIAFGAVAAAAAVLISGRCLQLIFDPASGSLRSLRTLDARQS